MLLWKFEWTSYPKNFCLNSPQLTNICQSMSERIIQPNSRIHLGEREWKKGLTFTMIGQLSYSLTKSQNHWKGKPICTGDVVPFDRVEVAAESFNIRIILGCQGAQPVESTKAKGVLSCGQFIFTYWIQWQKIAKYLTLSFKAENSLCIFESYSFILIYLCVIFEGLFTTFSRIFDRVDGNQHYSIKATTIRQLLINLSAYD